MKRGSGRRWWRQCWRAGLLAGMVVGLGGAVFATGLNDTGQTTCYDDTGAVSPEPITHPRQDCTVGRDAAAAAGVLPKTGAGSKGFDYTKIANNGSVLPANATLGPNPDQWACTRDNLTGLTWEVKTDDVSFGYRGLRDKGWIYTWYDDIHTDNNGGYPGVKGSNTCNGTLPNNECNTQAYVAAVNAADLCGHSDWRVPNVKELQGLMDYGISRPDSTSSASVDSAYFPNTVVSFYWSSLTIANLLPTKDYAWIFEFGYGSASEQRKANYAAVQLVRGGQ